jgi:hypothetical protein
MINRAQERCQNMDKEGVPSSSGIDIIDGETESDGTPPVKKMLRYTHVKSHNLSTRCVRNRLVQACQQVVKILLFYQVATSLSV